ESGEARVRGRSWTGGGHLGIASDVATPNMSPRVGEFYHSAEAFIPASADLRRAEQPSEIVGEFFDVGNGRPCEHPVADRVDEVNPAVRDGQLLLDRRFDADALESGMLLNEFCRRFAAPRGNPDADHALLVGALHRAGLPRRVERTFAICVAVR